MLKQYLSLQRLSVFLTILTCLSPILVSMVSALNLLSRNPLVLNYGAQDIAKDILTPITLILTVGLLFSLGSVRIFPILRFWSRLSRGLKAMTLSPIALFALLLVWISPSLSYSSFVSSYYSRIGMMIQLVPPGWLHLISAVCSLIVIAEYLIAQTHLRAG